LGESLPEEWAKITKWLNLLCPKPDAYLVSGHPENAEETMLYYVTRWGGGSGRQKKESKTRFHFQKICWKILDNNHSLGTGVNGDLVAAVQEDSVFMMNLRSEEGRWHKIGGRKFTCVAAHPNDWLVATGDDSGRILLWRNFLEEKSPAKSVFHWHTLPVADLIFSTDGMLFYQTVL
jgi:hypothetical protein